MENPVMTRTALGRIASVGALYDMRTDNFCGISIFKIAIPSASITISDSPFSDTQIITSEKYTEKFEKMDVNAELSVSLLAGNISLEGSGKFLYDKTNTSRIAKCSLIHKIQTKDEQLNINHEDFRIALSTDAIRDDSATHILTGISWGAALVISCTYENKDNKILKDVKGKLSAKVTWLKASISGDASFKDEVSEKDMKFEIRIFGDVVPENGGLPVTFEGALDLMKQLPRLVSNYNAGKGKPLVYRFLPISKLRGYLNLEIKIDSMLISLEDSALAQIVNIFDELSAAKQELNDFHQEVTEHRNWLRKQENEMISKYVRNAAVAETTMKSNLSQILISVRSGKTKITEMTDFISKFYASDIAPHTIAATMDSWKSLQKRIKFSERLVMKGPIYIDLKQSLDDLLPFDKPETISIVFYFRFSQFGSQDCWKRNYSLFLNKMENKAVQGSETTYYAMDCDLHDITLPEDISSCVKVYKGDECTVEDLLEDEKQNKREDPGASRLSTSKVTPTTYHIPKYTTISKDLHHLLATSGGNFKAMFYHRLASTEAMSEVSAQVPNKFYPDKWKQIEANLSRLCQSSLRSYFKENPSDIGQRVGTAVRAYCSDAFYSDFEILSGKDMACHVVSMLPQIVAQALLLPSLLSSCPIPILETGKSGVLFVTKNLCCSLLANAFFSTFPQYRENLPDINFHRLFNKGHSWERSKVKGEKVICLLNYFRQMSNCQEKLGHYVISYERRRLKEWELPIWENSSQKLIKVVVEPRKKIEEADGMLQVYFANKVIGEGWFNDEAVMEEILCAICPELILARLFTEPLDDNEVLVISGAHQFSKYKGYASTFEFVEPHVIIDLGRDHLGRLNTHVVAMDALHFQGNLTQQFQKRYIDRELRKSYVGFFQKNYPIPVATGNWDCEAFNGDKELKFLIQWISASISGCPSLHYHTERDDYQATLINEIVALIQNKDIHAGELYELVIKFHKNLSDYTSIFQYIQGDLLWRS